MLKSLIVTLLLSSFVNAQEVLKAEGKWCETNANVLTDFGNQVLQSNERLFVIAQIGNRERRVMNHRRLENLREFYRATFGTMLKPEQICFTEGDIVNGEGELIFYLGSKLKWKVTFKPNSDFCVSCCDWPEPRYYGLGRKDKKIPSRRIKR